MDYMDVSQVLEVPDTPDRLATAAHNNNIERRNDASMDHRITNHDYIYERMRNQPREKGKSTMVNGNRRLFIHSNKCSNSPVSHSGSSRPFKDARPTVDTNRHDKGKALCNSDDQKSTCQKGVTLAGLTEKSQHGQTANASRKGVLSLGRCRAIDTTNTSSKSCEPNNTLKTTPNSGNEKVESNSSAFMQPCTSSIVTRRKMLVRNGCISPHNIAKSKNVAEKCEISNVVKEVRSSSGTPASEGQSNVVDIKDLIAEAKDSRRCNKGKGVARHPTSSEEPDAGNSHSSHSHRKLTLKEPTVGSSETLDASRCSTESDRWRTTLNHRKQREIEQQQKNGSINHMNEREIVDLDATVSPKNQREVNVSRNLGKRSMPGVDESTCEPSTSRSKRNKSVHGVGPSNPVVEPNIHNIEDSSVRDQQLEADEMLARELQEQLYNEEVTPAVEIDEMDSRLAFAMSMQQDNSLWNGGGRQLIRRPAPLISSVRGEHIPSSNSRRPSIRRRLQPQPRTYIRMPHSRRGSLPPRRTNNRRNSIFPANMDVDMRMEILETLEDIGGMRVPNNLLQVGREFNEDDYEMLLALDEDNHRHGGATQAQINNLPESTVQAENLQECSICLETPTIGETIRHLPCLHRFHKSCIDQWLRRKTSCPVCKSSIS